MAQFDIECVTRTLVSVIPRCSAENLQVTLLDVRQGLPSIETLGHKDIEVLLKAQALEMGGDICHSRTRGISSIAERVPDTGVVSISPDGPPRKLFG